jgi:hypothetical protein
MNIKNFFKAVILIAGIINYLPIYASVTEAYDCSFPITDGQQSVRKFSLTLEVYKCLKHNNHQDMVVVNSEEQIVPFTVSAPSRELNVKKYTSDMAFYHEPSAATFKTGDQIKRIASMTGIPSGEETDAQWQHKNKYYSSLLLKQKETEAVLKSITIKKRHSNKPVSAIVIIESSDDLQHWTTVLNPLSIMYLPADGSDLQSNVLQIASGSIQKYLRLAILSNVKDFSKEITAVTGDYELSSYDKVPMIWSRVESLQPLDDEGAWTASLPDLRPISKLRFTPTDNIALYQGSIYIKRYINPTAPTTEKQNKNNARKKIGKLISKATHSPLKRSASNVNQWVYLSDFTQYELKASNDIIKSSDIQIRTTQSKDWKFVFSEPDNPLQSQLPVIHMGWKPPQVTYIAQGNGPFYLLAGNTVVPKGLSSPSRAIPLNEDIELVKLSAPKPPVNLAPISADDDNSPSYNLTKALLWLTLAMGVLLMAIMAYQLSKSITRDR